MAPSIHPPCTPASSCQPARCHPTPPPCEWPEECLRNTTILNIPPCKSAASIMATRSKTRCIACGKYGHNRPVGNNLNDPRRVQYIHNYLRRKEHEMNLKRHDKLTGTHLFTDYMRSRGSFKAFSDCCSGHGHRGRLSYRKLGTQRCKVRRERTRVRYAHTKSRYNRLNKDPYDNPRPRKWCTIL